MSSFVARLTCDEPTARRLAAAIDAGLGGGDLVCSAFEADGGPWQLAIHVGDASLETALRGLIKNAVGEAAERALSFEPVGDVDWVAQSLAGLKPVRAGRFIVHGAHDRARVPVNAIGIEIEAALAFGTGHHGSTRGCLAALDALAKRKRQTPIPPLKGEGRSRKARSGWGHSRNPHPARSTRHPPPCRGRDKKILDVGTGSGVLAIAAAKTFRKFVIASDIDAVSIASAKANARRNGAPTIRFARAAGTRDRVITRHAPYDLIFANILLGPLVRLAVPLARLARAGATIVLSGLLPSQANAALAIYRAQGLALARRRALDGWVTLTLTKGNRPGRG